MNKALVAEALKSIQKKYANELQNCNEFIRQELQSDAPQVPQLLDTIEKSRGKQLRPLIAFTIFSAFNKDMMQAARMAATFESLHVASLVHDDVIDNCDSRRSMPTMNQAFGNSQAVLLGDIIFTGIYKHAAKLGSIELVDQVSDTIKTLVEGELFQQAHSFNLDAKEEEYEVVIARKTSALLVLAGTASARYCGANEDQIKALESYFFNLGQLFQIADDMADFFLAGLDDDKDRGVDIANGFITLPWIYLLREVSDEEKNTISKLINSGEPCGYTNTTIKELSDRYQVKAQLNAKLDAHINEMKDALQGLSQDIDTSELQTYLNYVEISYKSFLF